MKSDRLQTGYAYLVTAMVLLLLAAILFVSPTIGPGALDSEITFDTVFMNTVLELDQAKWQWAEAKHKSEHDLPTMEDLAPFLGNWTNNIHRLIGLGVDYKITPFSEEEHQSDIATLTRDLYFMHGFSYFYPAGTQYCPRTGWSSPNTAPTSSLRAFYFNHQGLPAEILFVLAMANLIVFVIKKIRHSKVARS